MGNGIEFEELDVLRFARAIERDCQEGVKWERRKLEWLLQVEEQAKAEAGDTLEAA